MNQLRNGIDVPKIFHEFLGTKTTVFDLMLILLPSSALTALLVWSAAPVFRDMNLWKSALMVILVFDIFAGAIANLTNGTNDYYAAQPARRYLFIAIHIQPMIFSWLLGDYFMVSLFVWLYTVLVALIVNAFMQHPAQRAVAGAGLLVGLTLLIIFTNLPAVLSITLTMFMIKVIYSFTVDHNESIRKGVKKYNGNVHP